MLYDRHHVFLNGESWRAGGADAKLLQKLADQGHLSAAQLARASADLQDCLIDWSESGWLVLE